MVKGGIEGSCDSQNLWRAMAKDKPEMPAPAMMIFLPARKAELGFVVFAIVFSVYVVYEVYFVDSNVRDINQLLRSYMYLYFVLLQ